MSFGENNGGGGYYRGPHLLARREGGPVRRVQRHVSLPRCDGHETVDVAVPLVSKPPPETWYLNENFLPAASASVTVADPVIGKPGCGVFGPVFAVTRQSNVAPAWPSAVLEHVTTASTI